MGQEFDREDAMMEEPVCEDCNGTGLVDVDLGGGIGGKAECSCKE